MRQATWTLFLVVGILYAVQESVTHKHLEVESSEAMNLAASGNLEAPEITLVPRPALKAAPVTIDFSEFYVFGPRAPEPTAKLLGLNGKRVTLVGFMAQMELPPRGGFYLAPYPAVCDESGAGRGGLPPPSVLVLPLAARGKEVAFVDGALEVTGILDVGNKPSDDGEVASLRLILDDPNEIKLARTRSTAEAARPNRKD